MRFIDVTPRVGVWIEIDRLTDMSSLNQSLPAWECGLKYISFVLLEAAVRHSPRGSVD